MRILIYILTLLAALAFGIFVPSAITDDFAGQILIALIGGFAIGMVGNGLALAVDD